jgi:hypothetical protein
VLVFYLAVLPHFLSGRRSRWLLALAWSHELCLGRLLALTAGFTASERK